MPAQVDSQDAEIVGKADELMPPLARIAPEPMEEDECSSGSLGRDVNDRERERLGGVEAHKTTVELDVGLHTPPLARGLYPEKEPRSLRGAHPERGAAQRPGLHASRAPSSRQHQRLRGCPA